MTSAVTQPIEPLNAETLFADWRAQLLAAPQILVGLSGGLDSVVLLKLLCEVVAADKITAVHVNHGLSPNATSWQQRAEAVCDALGVACHSETVAVVAAGEGLESAAREARYTVFERLLVADGLLLLAHHADDQVETVLYRLLNGAGSKGLAGIPAQRAVGNGRLIRPLLTQPKTALHNYAIANNLSWVDDESNQREHHDRNYLRHGVVPALAKRWPNYFQRIGRSAQLSDEADQLSTLFAQQDLNTLSLRDERAGWSLSLSQLTTLDLLRQKNVLRHWPSMHGFAALNQRVIAEILDTLVTARDDAAPKVLRGEIQFCRFREKLYLIRLNDQSAAADRVRAASSGADVDLWSLEETFSLPRGQQLSASFVQGAGLKLPPGSALRVRFRLGGERCQPAGRGHSNTVKKLLQEYALEPWWRDQVPLLYFDDELVAVGDLWVCQGRQAGPLENSLKIHWQTNSL